MLLVEGCPAAWPALGPQPGARDTAGQQGTHMASSPSSFSKSPRYDCQAVGAVSGADSSTRLAATASTSTCRVRPHSRGQGCRGSMLLPPACCSCLPPQPCCPGKLGRLPCCPQPHASLFERAGPGSGPHLPRWCARARANAQALPVRGRGRLDGAPGRAQPHQRGQRAHRGARAMCAPAEWVRRRAGCCRRARARGCHLLRSPAQGAWNVKQCCEAVQPSPTEPAADVYLGNPLLPCRLWAACTQYHFPSTVRALVYLACLTLQQRLQLSDTLRLFANCCEEQGACARTARA